MEFDFDSGGVAIDESFPWLRESFPKEGKRILYLDADYIPYTVGFCSKPYEYEQYLEGKFNLDSKINHACFLIKDAMDKAQADGIVFFVTDGRTNFRTKLTTHYKKQRTDEKPVFWQEVKDWLWSHSNVVHSIRNEADDMISIHANEFYKTLDEEGVERTQEMYKLWCPIIIGSKDKDVNQVFGWHVDLNTGEHYWVDELGELKPKYKDKELINYDYWRTVDGRPVPHDYEGVVDTYKRGAQTGEPKLKRVKCGTKVEPRLHKLGGTGFKFFCAQVLMGDTVDNYFGLPNFGATKALALLDSCQSKEDCLSIVVREYKQVYPDTWKEELTLQGRYAFMQQEVDELWEIPEWVS